MLFQGMTLTYEGHPQWKVQAEIPDKPEEEEEEEEDKEEVDLTPSEKRKIFEERNFATFIFEPKQWDKEKIYEIEMNVEEFEDVGDEFEI